MPIQVLNTIHVSPVVENWITALSVSHAWQWFGGCSREFMCLWWINFFRCDYFACGMYYYCMYNGVVCNTYMYFPFLPLYATALVMVAAFWHVKAYGNTIWAEMRATKMWQLRDKAFQLLRAKYISGSFACRKKNCLLLRKAFMEQWKHSRDHRDYAFVPN